MNKFFQMLKAAKSESGKKWIRYAMLPSGIYEISAPYSKHAFDWNMFEIWWKDGNILIQANDLFERMLKNLKTHDNSNVWEGFDFDDDVCCRLYVDAVDLHADINIAITSDGTVVYLDKDRRVMKNVKPYLKRLGFTLFR